MVIIAVIATGCVDEGKPKYSPGDIIAEKPTSDTFTVILDYNQNTGEYKTNYISKVAGEWTNFAPTKHESWDDREIIETLYPVKIDHVDLATVMSWDEYSKAVGYEEVSAIHTQKYIPGDIIAREENKDIAWVILDYNQKNDEYQKNYILKVAGEWSHLAETKDESWEDRAYTEDIRPVKIGHVDLATIMSWDEYWKEGSYEAPATTPTQIATPILESKKPEILSMNSYIEDSGYFKVVGEVKNNLQSNIDYVKLTATFYDAGGKVVGSDFTYAELDILKPNQKSPFEISSYPDKITPDEYKVHLSYDTTAQSPYTGLVILSHSDKIDNRGYHKIIGEVKNNGARASSFVRVVSSYYDAKGEVIGTDYTYTEPPDIAAGDSAPFELSSYPRKVRPSSYELQVQGR